MTGGTATLCESARQQIWEEYKATEEPSTITTKVKTSGEAVVSSPRLEYGPLLEPRDDVRSDEDVEVDSFTFHSGAAVLVPG